MFQNNKANELNFWKDLANRGSKKAIIKYVSFFTDDSRYKDSIILQTFKTYSQMNNFEKMAHYGKLFMNILNEKEAQEKKTKKVLPIEYYHQAALRKDTEAIFEYGIALILYHDEYNFEKDDYLYYTFTSRQPHISAVFMYATMVLNGIGTSFDHKKATRYFKKMVSNQFKQAEIIWQSFLKEDIKSSFGKKTDQNEIFLPVTPKNKYVVKTITMDTDFIDIAARQFKIGANRHHLKSMFMYATMLLHGIVVEQNIKEALNIFKTAADENFLPACVQYANILKNGIYVDSNTKQAIEYLCCKKVIQLNAIKIKQ